MGLFSRRAQPAPEERALTDVPWNVGTPLVQTASEQRALTLTPVFAAVRHICDLVSTLPLGAFRRAGDERQPLPNLPQLFKQLDDDGNLLPWLFESAASIVLRGNAVGLITERDGFGFPIGIRWLSMDYVSVDDAVRPAVWRYRGAVVKRDELVHIPWVKAPERTLGLSPIEFYALNINSGLGAQSYGNDFFSNGGIPPGTFKNANKTIDPVQADAVKARLVGAIRTRQPIVYGADWDYNPITIPPEQAQFVETLKMSANQIAAIYGIAPEEVGGEAANSLTYSNEEMRQTTRISNLRPYLVRLEHGFSSILPERQYVKFNTNAVIRADIKSRFEVYKIARELGLYSLDELRALEDKPPLPNGEGASFVPKPVTPPVPQQAAPLSLVEGKPA